MIIIMVVAVNVTCFLADNLSLKISKVNSHLLSHLAKPCHYDKIYMGVTKTGSGSPFAKMSTF